MHKIIFGDFAKMFSDVKQHEFGEARKLFFEINGCNATIADAAELNEMVAAQKAEKAKKKLPSWMYGHYNHLSDCDHKGYNHFWDND
jgi:hypothetical protein